jgi:hypothetical protein
VKLPFLTKVLISESQKRGFVLKFLLFSLFYFLLALILFNYQSYISILTSNYDVLAKIKILIIIFFGSFYVISGVDILFLSIISVLFGLNIELVLRKIKFLAGAGNLHVAFGVGLISIAASGCASCGLSLASMVGLSAVLAALPFHGIELYFGSITILIVSLFYNLHTFVVACKIPQS